jgi:uncharacterized RDD family membrane protein YckC
MRYVGFWGRFGAYWIDVVVLLPLVVLSLWLAPKSRYYYIAGAVPSLLLGLGYHVYLVQRFGGTPGKLLLGQRIVKLSGDSVGYREAFLRYVVLMLLSVGAGLGIAIGALQIPDADYAGFATLQLRARALVEAAPWWYQPINVLSQVWVWSEFAVLLTNRKRRALHDFMAGTVVIRRDSA